MSYMSAATRGQGGEAAVDTKGGASAGPDPTRKGAVTPPSPRSQELAGRLKVDLREVVELVATTDPDERDNFAQLLEQALAVLRGGSGSTEATVPVVASRKSQKEEQGSESNDQTTPTATGAPAAVPSAAPMKQRSQKDMKGSKESKERPQEHQPSHEQQQTRPAKDKGGTAGSGRGSNKPKLQRHDSAPKQPQHPQQPQQPQLQPQQKQPEAADQATAFPQGGDLVKGIEGAHTPRDNNETATAEPQQRQRHEDPTENLLGAQQAPPQELQPKPSYAAALKGKTKQLQLSPSKVPKPAPHRQSPEPQQDTATIDRRQEERTSSAMRSQERRKEAEDRRKIMMEERLQKLEQNKDKQLLAKVRREGKIEKIRHHNEEKSEKALKRAESEVTKLKDKAQKHSTHVDEVLFVNQLTTENWRLMQEEKQQEREQQQEQLFEHRKEEKKEKERKKVEEYGKVLERGKGIEKGKKDKLLERNKHFSQKLEKLEEAKRLETETKRQKNEEREKKVQAQQKQQQEEVEARSRKSEERLEKSEQLLEEQRTLQRQKLEKEEKKVKDAKERRDHIDPQKPPHTSFHEVMGKKEGEAEEASVQLNKGIAAFSRSAKQFVEQYRADNKGLENKELQRARVKAVASKVENTSAVTGMSQCRQAVRDVLQILAAPSSNPAQIGIECALLRYQDTFGSFMRILVEARKAKDFVTVRLTSDLLHFLLTHPTEKHLNLDYVVRAGHCLQLVAIAHEEMQLLRRSNNSYMLSVVFSLLHHCTSFVLVQCAANPKLQSIRNQLMNFLDVANIGEYCLAVCCTYVAEDDMPCLQSSLQILSCQLQVVLKKKDKTARVEFHKRVIESMLTLLTNIFYPSGQAAQELSLEALCVVFTALRILNMVARLNLPLFQTIFSSAGTNFMMSLGASSRASGTATTTPGASGVYCTELLHIASALISITTQKERLLEKIDRHVADTKPLGCALTQSFKDALDFGITLEEIPSIPIMPPDEIIGKDDSGTGAGTAPPPKRGGGDQGKHPSRTSSSAALLAAHNTQHAAVVKPLPKCLPRAAMHEMLLLLGYASASNPGFQDMLCWGNERPFLAFLLSALPIQYFAMCKHVLFPTLIAMTFENTRNLSVMQGEMDTGVLLSFVRAEKSARPASLFLKIEQEQKKHEEKMKKGIANIMQSWAAIDEDDDEEPLDYSPSTQQNPDSKTATESAMSEQLSNVLKQSAKQQKHSGGTGGTPPPPARSEGSTPPSVSANDSLTAPPPSTHPQSTPASATGAGRPGAAALAPVQGTTALPQAVSTPHQPQQNSIAQASYFRFDKRFPIELWPQALAFYKEEEAPPDTK